MNSSNSDEIWKIFDIDDEVLFEAYNMSGIVSHLIRRFRVNLLVIENEKRHIRVIRYNEFI